ncbi:MAG: hypothetical protein Q7S40_00440 [Opitutaceae bacterium]|nr:hypothetical protein [Opitutaceae bacterium]
MKSILLRFALPVIGLMTAPLQGQQPTTPTLTQTLTYVKVAPGKAADYEQLLNESSRKVAEVRANAGEILSWTLLRTVMPAGQEARADYIISVISEGAPPVPATRASFEENLKKAGAKITASEFMEERSAISTLVASEMWRPRSRVGAPKKGHYIFIDYMKVQDATAYYEAEETIWRGMHEERIKRGEMSGWLFATKMLPAGTETPYTAYTANMYPSWQAAFAARSSNQSVFEKVHPGKNLEETMAKGLKRDLARRELWVVVERVEKST